MDFKNVDKKYSPIPFWSWNDELDPKELVDQIEWMHENGIGGFFMHARTGLKTPYLKEKWFECVEACLKKAKEIGYLKKMSEIFGVTVDYILNSHDSWEKPESFKKAERGFRSKVITAVTIAGIWTLAFLIYIIGWLLESNWWLLFIYALPVSLITLLVLNSVWESGKNNRHIIYALVASIFLTIYLTFISYNPWQILLLLIPAELIVFLSFRIKKSHK